MFIKAWIPFNAWYVDKYPQHNQNDTKIINELINSNNEIKNYIISLLSKTEDNHELFLYHLSRLHLAIENNKITHRDKTISFKLISFGEHKCEPIEYTDANGYNYVVSQPSITHNFYKALIVKEQRTYLDFKNPQYDIDRLKTFHQYLSLQNNEMKSQIIDLFKEVNPNKVLDLTTKEKDNFISLSKSKKIKFIDDKDLIAKSLIHILYKIRCMLFHGEIRPTENNSEIYNHSFHILKLIIDKLK
jgi:hypothetical protein